MFKNTSCKRGLATALSVMILSTFFTINAKASTVDDLKAYLGYTVEKVDKSKLDTDSMDVDTSKIDNMNATYNQLNGKLSAQEKELDQSLLKNESALGIVSKINDIKSTQQSVRDAQGDLRSAKSIKSTIDKAMQYIEDQGVNTTVNIDTYNYDIGDIGDKAIFIANGTCKLITPYGYKINNDGTHDEKHTGIDISASYGSVILDQWNGEIANIEDDEIAGCKKITIYHGNGIYTVYNHIAQNDLHIGHLIHEGDTIGTIGNSAGYDKTKENHIEYQIIVDGNYINPLLIYGKNSQIIFNTWLKTSYDTYTVAMGEAMFYTGPNGISNPNKDTAKPNTIDGAAKVTDGYSMPDPGILTGVDK